MVDSSKTEEEIKPLLPVPAEEPIVQVDEGPGSQASASFIPIIGLMVFGVTVGWFVGYVNGSILWVIPAVAIISGMTHRKIMHFRKYLLHSIIRLSEKGKVKPARYNRSLIFVRLTITRKVWSGSILFLKGSGLFSSLPSVPR